MKTMVIFGGSGGIGKILSNIFSEKYKVISLSSKDVDVTSIKEVENFFEQNDIDYVLNLSVLNRDIFVHKYGSINEADLKMQIDVNILGTVNVASASLRLFRKKQAGELIMFSSILSDNPLMATSIYSSSKSFIETFTKTCAIENASKNIKVNCIQLGYFDVGLFEDVSESVKQKVLSNIPFQKWGDVRDIASCIEMIIDNNYITGQTIKINGGL
jgi:NAD(P)-dependent dehydrogenase (short-subunit alcohol dehydrogenase family)